MELWFSVFCVILLPTQAISTWNSCMPKIENRQDFNFSTLNHSHNCNWYHVILPNWKIIKSTIDKKTITKRKSSKSSYGCSNHSNSEMEAECLAKNLSYLNLNISVSSSTLLKASWLTIFVSAKSNWTILLTDRFEPRFESHTGGKIRITLKNNKKFDNFF